MDASNFTILSAMDILRRHAQLVGVVFTTALVPLLAFIHALPNVYTSTASIAVKEQQISTDVVPSAMTMGTEGRLRVLTQRILSRSRLNQIAEQFELYPELKRERQANQTVAKALRSDIGLQVRNEGTSSEDATITFDISYRGTDPEKVRQVADSLALFFIEENKKDRRDQVAGTTDFLRSQLKETQEKLEAQERSVAEYKRRHIEELPEQLATNLVTLSQLKVQADVLSSQVATAQERREILNRRLAMINTKPVGGPVLMIAGDRGASFGGSGNTEENTPSNLGTGATLIGELETSKGRLAQLLVRFSEKHPDVLQLRKEVAALEQKIASQVVERQARVTTTIPSAAQSLPTSSPAQVVSAAAESARRATELTNLQTEYSGLDLEIQRKGAELARLRQEISAYQARVENGPKRDQELQTLNRDYSSTHELYLSLLKRLGTATLAGNLDQSQHGENFAIIEPALYPQDPAGPRRRLLSLGAIVLSLGAALVTVLFREVINPAFHKIEELRAFTTVEILGSVPQIATEAEWARQRTRRCVGGVALLTVICGLGMFSHTLGKGHSQVAKALSQSNGGIQLH